MNPVIAIPLLRCLDAGAVLLVGDWRLTGGYGTLPAIVNPHWDDKPMLTISRQIFVFAAKRGLIEADDIGPRVTTYRITKDGSAFLRDYRITRKFLRARNELPDSRDDDPSGWRKFKEEVEAKVPASGKNSATEETLVTLFRRNVGVPLASSKIIELMNEKFGLTSTGPKIRGMIARLRKKGCWIESDMAGFRYLGENADVREGTACAS